MRRSIPILVLLVGLLALLGCSNKSTTAPQTLNAAQEGAFASQAAQNGAIATGFAGSFSGGLDGTPGKPKANGSPTFFPPSPTFNPPDSSWKGPYPNPHQPGDSTWYYEPWIWQDTSGSFSDTVYVKFKPNKWGGDTGKVYRVDLEDLIHILAGSNKFNWDEAAWASYSNSGHDTTMTDGGVNITGSSTVNNSTSSFAYQFTWANCTRYGWTGNPRTCSGTFSWSATSSYLTKNYNLTGSYTFTGNHPGQIGYGEAKFSNVTFAKFYFISDGSGYYTLLSNNWQTQYQFTW